MRDTGDDVCSTLTHHVNSTNHLPLQADYLVSVLTMMFSDKLSWVTFTQEATAPCVSTKAEIELISGCHTIRPLYDDDSQSKT